MTILQKKYTTDVAPALQKKFGYGNVMASPRIAKVVLNAGVGRVREDKDRQDVEKYLALITGQKPAPRKAKKAIAAFKTRQGLVIGYQVTLRGRRMYDFLERFVRIALPRTRDFQGIPLGSFDPRGNLTVGVREHTVFPELIGEDYRFLFGLEVSIVMNAKRREEGIELLRMMGFPIQNKS